MIPFDDLYRGRWKVKQAFLGFLTGFWKPFTSLQISWNLQMVVYISIEKHKPNRLLNFPILQKIYFGNFVVECTS